MATYTGMVHNTLTCDTIELIIASDNSVGEFFAGVGRLSIIHAVNDLRKASRVWLNRKTPLAETAKSGWLQQHQHSFATEFGYMHNAQPTQNVSHPSSIGHISFFGATNDQACQSATQRPISLKYTYCPRGKILCICKPHTMLSSAMQGGFHQLRPQQCRTLKIET